MAGKINCLPEYAACLAGTEEKRKAINVTGPGSRQSL